MRALRKVCKKRRDPRIGRRIVDEHDANVGPQVIEHARNARSHVVRRVVHRDDDVDDVVRLDVRLRGLRHGRSLCIQARTRIHGSAIHQRALWRYAMMRS